MSAYRGNTGSRGAYFKKGSGGGVIVDPYEEAVKVLLHCDGADDSTVFTDRSLVPLTATAYGNARVKTNQSVFGGASAYFDGSGDYILLPADTPSLWLGTFPYMVEFRVRFEANVPCQMATFGKPTATVGSDVGWGIRWFGGTTYKMQIFGYDAGVAFLNFNSVTSFVSGTWYAIKVQRVGYKIQLYVNGVLDTEVAAAYGCFNYSDLFQLCLGRYTAADPYHMQGWIDEFRLTVGYSEPSGTYTPSALPFPNYS